MSLRTNQNGAEKRVWIDDIKPFRVKEGSTADRSMKIEVRAFTLTQKQAAASER
jgi:hypothetical protein